MPETQNLAELDGLPEMSEYRTFPGAARYLKVTRSRVSQMVRETDPKKRLPAKRIPDSRTGIIKVSDLDKVLARWQVDAETRLKALSR